VELQREFSINALTLELGENAPRVSPLFDMEQHFYDIATQAKVIQDKLHQKEDYELLSDLLDLRLLIQELRIDLLTTREILLQKV
jgi:hypothetical protein